MNAAKAFSCCRRCDERYVGCHDECTRYQAVRKEWDQRKQTEKVNRIHAGEVTAFFKESCVRKRER